MKKEKVFRSPLFYTGDKYKLVPELKKYFPENINKFIEPFVGGGSVFINTQAREFFLNDIDTNIITLHKYLSSFKNLDSLLEILFSKIEKHGFSCSLKSDVIPKELKEKYVKTYFARYNKESYLKLRDDFNSQKTKDLADLYLLLIYGFNHMLRFNREGKFNLPVGNVDFNKNVNDALENYINLTNQKNIKWFNLDYKKFLEQINFENNDFVYLDPPYLITSSEYNKLWNQKDDDELFEILDDLNSKKIKFALSDVVEYKGKTNEKLSLWAKKYNIYPIKSNYINYHDNTIKSFSEVLITNYGD